MKAALREFLADLHIHTALSPCAAQEMTPPAIVQAALAKGLSMIAICDHNSAANAKAVQQAAGEKLVVLAGMEITTAEEVHVLGLFESAEQACQVADKVQATLPQAKARYFTKFGEQSVMNSAGQIVARERLVLACASSFALQPVVKLITAHGGMAIPSHVDRRSFSITSQLGVFPSDVTFDAVEISPSAVKEKTGVWAYIAGISPANNASLPPTYGAEVLPADGQFRPTCPVIASSDSHFLADIGSVATVVKARGVSFAELKLALGGIDGRSVVIRA